MRYKIAVIGATGRVGREVLSTLTEFQDEAIDCVIALASKKSEGKKVSFGDKELTVLCLEDYDFVGTNVAIFCAGSHVSEEYVPIATQAGCIVIDNSSHFRMKEGVPLIIPEINKEKIMEYKNHNIISNPNCTTIQMLLVLHLLHQKAKIKRIVASTYQSTSGAGKAAMDELYDQTKKIFMNEAKKPKIFSKQIAFNCIPHVGEFMENGSTEEEWKMQEETKKILEEDIKVTATCVRVPVFIGHAMAVNVEFDQHITEEQAREVLSEAEDSGVLVYNRREDSEYITQIDVVQENAVYVSRIRRDNTVEHGLNMWIVADNLRKGAALNIVQILEILIREHLSIKCI
ncbi:Aspartate-semialdehyde dehydrogenase [Wolbachia pipientis]|uniref:aspartate-semialdehyde dehydrogenase n=1 Tax=Wolbachia TaxID=953 RepID=UPI0005129550|nr:MULTISPECIES: aspartate-semialdehyde dehydrogenase [Wolbachia]MBA8765976.1 aspartate-semialdehyde dehydrogenase [Wolbachia pipientis]QWE34694.1 Aspartate-semialdehyde dehydrogenase [Wolbachia endosymbiont of Drosophila simulans]CDR79326.1 aspartate-semialdehyde dehydrogenase,Aspartate-semialdehyde dehydrogenase 2,aspartate-semialdehyde dehydrogenase,Aspartate-semialdehyde dehydrogenase,aspartate-semialdehyde dehydrogenase,Semialdehyde dehydrogenase, dimerisation domain [Wolbachia endosymbiont